MVVVDRDVVAQEGPGRDLRGFPTSSLSTRDVLWRAHRRARSPWWFSSHGGRFDLPAPQGTCYAARDLEAAVREAAGQRLLSGGVVSAEFAAERVVSELRLSGAVSLADLTSRAAVRFGVSRGLSTMTPYDIPQQWARAFAADHPGIECHSRFTTGDLRCVAIFGPAGAHSIGTQRAVIPFAEAASRVGIASTGGTRLRINRPPST